MLLYDLLEVNGDNEDTGTVNDIQLWHGPEIIYNNWRKKFDLFVLPGILSSLL
jgi:hypothetical protein